LNLKSKSFKDVPYKFDQTILKVFGYEGQKKIKLIRVNCLRTAGVEIDDEFLSKVERGVNDTKLEESILRSKEKIFELAYCNPWDYFFTGTLDAKKYDRTDLDKFHKDLTQWIGNYNKNHKLHIKFLFVPELHSDGKSWHVHGFIYGLPKENLIQFKVGDKMGKTLAEKVARGDIVYNWTDYQEKFGFCDLEPIRNHEAVSKYVTKYMNKQLAKSVQELNAHTYYHSRGLKFADTIKKGSMDWCSITPSFVGKYCSFAWLDYSDAMLETLTSRFIN